MLDLLIRGGTVVARDGCYPADVGVQGGRVAGLYGPGGGPEAAEVQSATGLHVLPGVIDPHAHLRSRGRSFAESCERMSREAAAGGTTTLIDFTHCSGSYLDLLDELKQSIESRSIIDMGANPMIMNPAHIAELPELVRRHGIAAIKMFPAGLQRELYPDTFAADDGVLWLALRAAAAQNPKLLVRVHAENWEIAWALEPELRASGRGDAGVWTDMRPHVCEEETVRRVAFLAGKAGCPAYAVHLTTAAAPRIVASAWSEGTRLYGETCPHYLVLHRDHPRAMMGKYQPSLKTAADVDALWAGLRDGRIHCVGSDHIPVYGEDKRRGGPDIWTAVGGAPGTGTILPVLLHYGVHAGRLSLPDVVRVSSYNAARLMRLYPRKGAIQVGADADLALVDLQREVLIEPSLLNVDFTLYDGERFRGFPVQTFVRGRRVMADGQILVPPGGGRYLAAGPADTEVI